ncbi:MAG: ATP-binding protein [Solirubrobacteraceae bacterium]
MPIFASTAPVAPGERDPGAGRPPQSDPPHGATRRRTMGVRGYLAGLMVLFVVSAAAAVIYFHARSESDARASAVRDAGFAADGAAKLIARGVTDLRVAVKGLVADATVDRELLAHPSTCTLRYAQVGAFPTGHIDVLRPDGSVVCSSLAQPAGRRIGYEREPWLASLRSGTASLAPVRDPRTGHPAAVFAAPFTGGIGAAFVDLPAVGPDLGTELAGLRGLQYVITTADGATILAAWPAGARWIGRRVSDTPLRSGGSDGRGLDGRRALFSWRTVPGGGWRVYAGIDRSIALAPAGHLFARSLALILVALAVFLVAVAFVERRIARPISRLAAVIGGDMPSVPARLSSIGGPTELVALAESFRASAARIEEELSERRRAEQIAHGAERRARATAEAYRLLFESNPQPMWVFDSATLAFLEVNDAAVAHYGYTRDEFLTMRLSDIRAPGDRNRFDGSQPDAGEGAASGAIPPLSFGPRRHRRHDGKTLEVETVSHAVDFQGTSARLQMVTDVTDRRRLERQLAQTQRLESLGQLAGGVAHDFNNLLAAILNYAAFVGEEVALAQRGQRDRDWSAVRSDVEQVELAARRAAGLTHQLLAFARHEVIHPEAISLNEVVSETEQLLRRTLGEQVELSCALSDDLWAVMADPGQAEQVLVNLAVNARDALPGGGMLTIETANVDVDEAYAAARPALAPGSYVRLRVSDNGEGMDPATLERAFEPFFTTKPKGEGTGLGLAMVYGIVKQAGGHIQLYSEPGVGTTCTIMFPATARASAVGPAAPSDVPGGNDELILLVEDEGAIREVARRILSRRGYRVLTAAGGQEALELAQAHEGPIDLLLTDVIMPRMLGNEIAQRIRRSRPATRVLYMTGYAQQVLADESLADGGPLEKPFTEEGLLARVRDALEPQPD